MVEEVGQRGRRAGRSTNVNSCRFPSVRSRISEGSGALEGPVKDEGLGFGGPVRASATAVKQRTRAGDTRRRLPGS